MKSDNYDIALSFHNEAVKYYADDIERICANVRKNTGSDLKADIGDYIDDLPENEANRDDGMSFSPEKAPEPGGEAGDKTEAPGGRRSRKKKNADRTGFSGKFDVLFTEKRLSPEEFSLRSRIDRELLAEMRTDHACHPSKLTVIRACFGLELGLEESLDLLGSAGYALSSTSSFDLAIRYCMIKKLTDIDFINDILKELGEEIAL